MSQKSPLTFRIDKRFLQPGYRHQTEDWFPNIYAILIFTPSGHPIVTAAGEGEGEGGYGGPGCLPFQQWGVWPPRLQNFCTRHRVRRKLQGSSITTAESAVGVAPNEMSINCANFCHTSNVQMCRLINNRQIAGRILSRNIPMILLLCCL